jgi:hypothetical protein
MDQSPVSWIDIASPVVTFVAVILVPLGVAAWVIFKTVTEKPQATTPAPNTGSVDTAAEAADAHDAEDK